MSFQLLSRKVSAARELLNEWQLQSLEAHFMESTKSLETQRQSSRASRGYLFVEALFSFLRHREWLSVPAFQAIVVEFLQLDHGLSRPLATKVVETMLEDFIRMGLAKPRTLCVDDREFLTYAYVVAASAANDVQMEMDLGLGHALVRKLRDGVRVLEEARSDIFIPEYDAMLASIIVELGHQMRSRAWVLDEHRLKYRMLSELGDSAVAWILEEKISETLQLLTKIGLTHSGQDVPEELLSVFERAQLIVADRDGRGRIRGWEVSTDGAMITSQCLKLQHGSKLIESVSEFLALDLNWQMSILRDKKVVPIEFVMDLLANHMTRTAPQTVEIAVQRIVELGPDLLEAETLKSLLSAAHLPWHKAAVLRALREMTPNDEIAGIVADTLGREASGSMVEAAGKLLDRWSSV